MVVGHAGDMGDEIEVRRIRPDEWAELKDVRCRALADAPGAFLTTLAEAEALPDEQWQAVTPERATSDVNAAFVAVAADAAFVGLVGGFEIAADPGSVQLVQMWTAPEARRRGVGRRLVDAVIDWAGDRPVRLSVIRGNDGAQALYESMGFVLDDRPPYEGDPCVDEIHMVRDPGSPSRS